LKLTRNTLAWFRCRFRWAKNDDRSSHKEECRDNHRDDDVAAMLL